MYLSNNAASLFRIAKEELRHDFCKCKVGDKYANFLKYVNGTVYMKERCINRAFYISNIIDKNFCIKFSYSGWYIFGKKQVLDSLAKVIVKYYNKIYLRGLLKSLFIFTRMYMDTLEKMYNPDSEYIKNVIKPCFYKKLNLLFNLQRNKRMDKHFLILRNRVINNQAHILIDSDKTKVVPANLTEDYIEATYNILIEQQKRIEHLESIVKFLEHPNTLGNEDLLLEDPRRVR